MEKEIKEILEKHLPAATAGVMKEYIEKAERAKVAFEALKAINEKLEYEMKGKNKTITLLTKEIKYQGDLDAQVVWIKKEELSLETRKRGIALEIAQIQLQCAEDRNDKIESLVEKVFGHPNVSISTVRNKPAMIDPGYGGTPYKGVETEEENIITVESKV